ncbi:MAG: glycoside hydrolase family 2 TIM barrel-domain containing protein [Bacteroides sp.]|uniref:glycoside hydrolase family 2 TIM barrel-domain containing protein n=1 Tax=Bacteroides sp. TaxID=29523 RepID=UPI002FC8769F
MNRITKVLIIISCLFGSIACYGQRVKQTINDGWRFKIYPEDASALTFDTSQWETVSVPHSWNTKDADDETPGFYRGKGWYRKIIPIETLIPDQRVFLSFEGANQETNVYVNGQLVGNHRGGYAAFTFDVTEAVKIGTNEITVCVDNTHNPDIAPLSADYTFFGGIYRDVYLIYTSPSHISTTHHASSGVYLTTQKLTDQQAEISIKTYISNALMSNQTLILETEVVDTNGKQVAVSNEKIQVKGGIRNTPFESFLTISKPKRWDVDDPYLYTVYSRLRDKKGTLLDCVVNSLGIREFSFDADKGFFLNGRYRKLIGTNRHQDYLGLGNALRDEMHVRDIKLVKNMGSNFLRVAHYPQDPVVMQMCDQLGLLTSVEIPVVNAITQSDAFLQNCIEQVTEMVYQNYNYPSVVIWAYMNEVLLRPPFDPNNSEERSNYLKFLNKIATAIESKIREIDPHRYTMLPCHAAYPIYEESGIAALPMMLGFNIYNGWYGGQVNEFEKGLENLHRIFPTKPLFITEYGADVDARLHSFSPVRFDFSNEFGSFFHEHYIPEILKRKFVVGATVWNLNDFYSETRRDAVPHINNKGLVGIDRIPKDTYYLYQAYLKETPLLHICSKTWTSRAGASKDGLTSMQPLKIYTNAERVEIHLNGKNLGLFPVVEKIVETKIPFINGRNVIDAVIEKNGISYRDQYVCNFNCINVKQGFKEMNVMLGTERYFEDRTAELCWIPEQIYQTGSWGYVGGERMKTKTRYGFLPASDIEILGTDQDPIFQTQRTGIKSFKAEVPDGGYAVYLYWAELTSDKKKEALAYNLGNDALLPNYSNRSFSITINDICVAKRINIAEEYGSERAVIKKFEVQVCQGKGLSIDFGAIESAPILNAIRIVKIY